MCKFVFSVHARDYHRMYHFLKSNPKILHRPLCNNDAQLDFYCTDLRETKAVVLKYYYNSLRKSLENPPGSLIVADASDFVKDRY